MTINQRVVVRIGEIQRGEQVGFVDLDAVRGPRDVPVRPKGWYGLRVRPGREFAMLKKLREHNVSCYLPTMIESRTVTKVVRGGYESEVKRDHSSPLFSGVILVPDFEVEVDCRIGMVLGFIELFTIGPCLIRFKPEDIAVFRMLELLGNTRPSERKRVYEIGQEVRVVDGPFASFTAYIERGIDSAGRLGVLVDIFKRMTPLEIEERQIEPIS